MQVGWIDLHRMCKELVFALPTDVECISLSPVAVKIFLSDLQLRLFFCDAEGESIVSAHHCRY